MGVIQAGFEEVVAEEVPLVRFEPCPWYAYDVDDSLAACLDCGWREEDHLAEMEVPFGEAHWARLAERRAS